jgi:hypothetical protein
MDEAAIVGAWRMVSYHGRNAAGEKGFAAGPDARGLLIYSGDGHMSAVISGGERPRFHSDDYRGGTAEETHAAFNSYLSYCGRYTLSGDTVTHHVDMSMFPNWVGTNQLRHVRFEADRLVLTAPPVLFRGQEWTYELTWERT